MVWSRLVNFENLTAQGTPIYNFFVWHRSALPLITGCPLLSCKDRSIDFVRLIAIRFSLGVEIFNQVILIAFNGIGFSFNTWKVLQHCFQSRSCNQPTTIYFSRQICKIDTPHMAGYFNAVLFISSFQFSPKAIFNCVLSLSQPVFFNLSVLLYIHYLTIHANRILVSIKLELSCIVVLPFNTPGICNRLGLVQHSLEGFRP